MLGMEKLDSATAGLTEENQIQVARWTQYAINKDLPFDAMWCVIPPGRSSQRDCHPERELAVVVNGDADFEQAENAPEPGERVTAAQGTAVMLAGDEAHIVHNRSDTEPLVLLSIYWLPQSAAPVVPAEADARP